MTNSGDRTTRWIFVIYLAKDPCFINSNVRRVQHERTAFGARIGSAPYTNFNSAATQKPSLQFLSFRGVHASQSVNSRQLLRQFRIVVDPQNLQVISALRVNSRTALFKD